MPQTHTMRYCKHIRRGIAAVGLAGGTGLATLRALPDVDADADATAAAVTPHHKCNADIKFDVDKIRREIEQRSSAAAGSGEFGTKWLLGELSSDHAGETGAVWIYKGALDAMKVNKRSAAAAQAFAREHTKAEQRHLDLIETVVPPEGRTRLIPMWKLSGWMLGAIPTLVGPEALFATVEAVETFVEKHYMQQINPLEADGSCPELVKMLRACCEDEVHHRDDAAARARAAGLEPSMAVMAWQALVEGGSAAAAEVARRV